jgi:hypothetical protein
MSIALMMMMTTDITFLLTTEARVLRNGWTRVLLWLSKVLNKAMFSFFIYNRLISEPEQ